MKDELLLIQSFLQEVVLHAALSNKIPDRCPDSKFPVLCSYAVNVSV